MNVVKKLKLRDIDGKQTPYNIGALAENIEINEDNIISLLEGEKANFNSLPNFLKLKLNYITILNDNGNVTSFNDIKETGIYKILKSIANDCPVTNSVNSSLIVLNNNKTIYQIFFNDSESFVIRKCTITGSNYEWEEWDDTLNKVYTGTKRGLVPAKTEAQSTERYLKVNGDWAEPNLDSKYPNVNKTNEFKDTTTASVKYTEKVVEETTEIEETKEASTIFNGGIYIKDTTNVTITPLEYDGQPYNNIEASAIFEGGVYIEKDVRVGTEGKVYGAVWNDLADSITVNEDAEIEPGYCYCLKNGKYIKSSKYLDNGIIGIHSDTYGFKMGDKLDNKQLDCAVSGFILAYVDKDYLPGTALTCTKNGYLTKIKFKDKQRFPEKIIATYWKDELNEEWGPDNKKIKVNGRKWVKIK